MRWSMPGNRALVLKPIQAASRMATMVGQCSSRRMQAYPSYR
jgi:hypothetical protein